MVEEKRERERTERASRNLVFGGFKDYTLAVNHILTRSHHGTAAERTRGQYRH
jgi:hypothetical protein